MSGTNTEEAYVIMREKRVKKLPIVAKVGACCPHMVSNGFPVATGQ
jgi:hypothetical protein